MIYQPRNAPFGVNLIADPGLTVEVIIFAATGTVGTFGPYPTIYESGAYWAETVAPAVSGLYFLAWILNGSLEFAEQLMVTTSEWIPEPDPDPDPTAGYATTSDIEARFGRPLTDQETTSYQSIIDAVSEEVDVKLGRRDRLPAPVNPIIKGVVVTAAIRGAANPSGVARRSERLGAVSRSETFPRSGNDSTWLTSTEERLIRRAIYRKTTGSPRIGSVLDDVAPY